MHTRSWTILILYAIVPSLGISRMSKKCTSYATSKDPQKNDYKKERKKKDGRSVSWGLGLGLARAESPYQIDETEETHVTTPDARRLRQRFLERLLPVAYEGVVQCFRCGK